MNSMKEEPEDEDLDDLKPDAEEPDDPALDCEDLDVVDRSAAVVEATPGCAVSFYIDNKRHHGVCLGIIGNELLIEHKGSTRCFLFICKLTKITPRLRAGVASATIVVGNLKPCRYRSLPKKWLWQMITTGQKWKGVERGGGLVPSPAELLGGDYQMELF